MSYCELTLTERSTLKVALAQQMSFRAIARFLKRAPSTISREVRRHAGARQHYQAHKAQHNRQYLPKKTDLSVYSQAVLDEIALALNLRPRKRFGFSCPIEQLTKVMLAEHNKPASRH